MKIIGLTGAAGAGKDTARTVLENYFGCKGLAFADPMRSMLGALLDDCGIDKAFMTSRELKEMPMPGLGISYRHAAQTLGTEWGRAMDRDLWLKVAGAKMASCMNITGRNTVFVVSDVRFANEAKWIKEIGGVIWHINRPDAQAVRYHASESGLPASLVDANITNGGDINDFKAAVYDMALQTLDAWGVLGDALDLSSQKEGEAP